MSCEVLLKMSSNLAVALRSVLVNALNVVNAAPVPEDASLEKLADRLVEAMLAEPEKPKKVRKSKKSDASATESETEVPVAAPAAEPKPKKARAKKAAEPAAEPAAAPVAEAPAAEPAAEPKPKKARAKKAAAEPAADATPEAAKPKKAKKEKPAGVNIDKLTPTQMKLLKPIADELKVEVDKAKLLEHLNGLSADVFAAKTIYDHFRELVQPAPAAEVKEVDSIVVDFNGKTYYVTPDDKKVWEETEDGAHKFVGHVGMAAFADMKI